jgi:RNA polymerase sigma factor (sigma-70 family)
VKKFTVVLKRKDEGTNGVTASEAHKIYEVDETLWSDVDDYLAGPKGIVWDDFNKDEWFVATIFNNTMMPPIEPPNPVVPLTESTAPKPDARILPSNEDLAKLGEDELISTFIPVAKLIGRFNEDTKQEAILGLIEAVGRLKTIQHDGIKQYLCTCIKGRVRGYIEKLPIVHVPRYVYKEIKERQSREQSGEVETDSLDPSGDVGDSIYDFIPIDGNMEIPVSDFLGNLVAKDLLEGIVKRLSLNPRQLQIVLLRLDGKTDTEIGQELGESQQVINYQRKQIKDKLKAWLKM